LVKSTDALAKTGFDALLVSSGEPTTYFADDNDAPFHPVPHFAHWCPLEGPHHLLRVEPGKRPRLVRYAPDDYWYEQKGLGDPFWASEFDLVEAKTVDDVWKAIGPRRNAAYVGNEVDRAGAYGLALNPEKLLSRLDWDRAYKTGYEVETLDEATARGAKGHSAALAAFEAGASEIEIHYAFVQAMEATEDELPYNTIVALNEKSAFLHYYNKRSVKGGKTLLIDAGAKTRGYGSDITRTHVAKSCDPRFVALRDGVEKFQKKLCGGVRPGVPFLDLHLEAHLEVAKLLKENGLLRAEPEESVERGWTRPFFPHGLGHHLGIQVHDVGGHQKDPEGHRLPPPKEHPYLRNTRTIEPRQVFTIEPGVYFIEMLLRDFREGEASARFDWKLIEELAPFG
jgi:Xaa-Pro dipeptidase